MLPSTLRMEAPGGALLLRVMPSTVSVPTAPFRSTDILCQSPSVTITSLTISVTPEPTLNL